MSSALLLSSPQRPREKCRKTWILQADPAECRTLYHRGAEECILKILEPRKMLSSFLHLCRYFTHQPLRCRISAGDVNASWPVSTAAVFRPSGLRAWYVRPCCGRDDISTCVGTPSSDRDPAARGQYVPNDVMLDATKQQIMMMRIHNMSGKMALLRLQRVVIILTTGADGSFIAACHRLISASWTRFSPRLADKNFGQRSPAGESMSTL